MEKTKKYAAATVCAVVALVQGCPATDEFSRMSRDEIAQQAIDDTLDQWEDEMPEDTSTCAEQRLNIEIIRLDDEHFNDSCLNPAPGTIGCYYQRTGGSYPFVFIRNGVVHTNDSWYRLIRHEATHWMEVCTGRDKTSNPNHDDVEAWDMVGEHESH